MTSPLTPTGHGAGRGVNRLLTVDEIAELLGVSHYTVYRETQAGNIPAYRIGRNLRFDPEQVLAALATKPPTPVAPNLTPRELLQRTKPKPKPRNKETR